MPCYRDDLGRERIMTNRGFSLFSQICFTHIFLLSQTSCLRKNNTIKQIFLFIYLFIYGCVGSSFLCEGFLQLRQVGATLHRGAQASLVAEHRLQTRRLSNCGSRAQLLCGMWDLPRPGLEPVSPALAGRFSTTAPPGKPLSKYF